MNEIPRLDIKFEKTLVVAKSRRLNAAWTLEFGDENDIEFRPGDNDLWTCRYHFGWGLDQRAVLMEAFSKWCRERSFHVNTEGPVELYNRIEVAGLDDDDVTEMRMRWQ